MPVVSASESESESTEVVLTLSKGTSAWTVTMCPKPRDSIKAKIPGIKSFIAVQNAWTPLFKSSALVHALHDRYGYPKVLDFGKTVAWIIPNVDAKEYKKALRAVAADVVPNCERRSQHPRAHREQRRMFEVPSGCEALCFIAPLCE